MAFNPMNTFDPDRPSRVHDQSRIWGSDPYCVLEADILSCSIRRFRAASPAKILIGVQFVEPPACRLPMLEDLN
jgi:hypothetical protein